MIITSYNGIAQNITTQEARLALEQAPFDKEKTIMLIYQLEAIENPNALQTAFQASAQGIMCLHTGNPAKRLKYAKLASQLANSAVKMDNNSLEVRFMRFAIESQVPKILGLSKNVQEDKFFLLEKFNKENFGTIPFHSLEEIVHVLEESKFFSTSEIITMKQELTNK